MDGAHGFVEQKIAESDAKRAAQWTQDFTSLNTYAQSVEPNRARF